MDATSTPPCGRDVFVSGFADAASLGDVLREAFGPARPAVLIADAAQPFSGEAIGQIPRIEIHPLEADGDFLFKVAIDLDIPVDTGVFVTLARRHGISIAWAVDETSQRDDYFVAFPDGNVSIHGLHFRETESSFSCLLVRQP